MAEGRPGPVIMLRALPVPATDGRSRPLSSPFAVRVERVEVEYVVSDEILLMYGHGALIDEALEDYGATIIDYYEMLIEREEAGDLGSNERFPLELLAALFGRMRRER